MPGGTYHCSIKAETISKNRDSPGGGSASRRAAGQPGNQPAHSGCCPSTHGQLQPRDLRPAPGEQQRCRALPHIALLLTCCTPPLQHQQRSKRGVPRLLSYRAAELPISLSSKRLPSASPVFMNLQFPPKLQSPWRAQRLLTCITPSGVHTAHDENFILVLTKLKGGGGGRVSNIFRGRCQHPRSREQPTSSFHISTQEKHGGLA